MDYFLFNFSGVQFHYTMSQKKLSTHSKTPRLTQQVDSLPQPRRFYVHIAPSAEPAKLIHFLFLGSTSSFLAE